MSETDDTDELLLIPPDFSLNEDIPFSPNDSFAPYYHIVDNLITQVYKLKNRINYIEHNSDLSLGTLSISVESINNMPSSGSSCKRCYSYESLPHHSEQRRSSFQPSMPGSTQSTPLKPRSKLMLKSVPNSPKADLHTKFIGKPLQCAGSPTNYEKFMSSRSRDLLQEEDNVLNEIDNFLSNVKIIKKIDAARNLEKDFDQVKSDKYGRKRGVLEDVQQILREMDEQQVKLESCKIRPEDKSRNKDELRKVPSWKSVEGTYSNSTNGNEPIQIRESKSDTSIMNSKQQLTNCADLPKSVHPNRVFHRTIPEDTLREEAFSKFPKRVTDRIFKMPGNSEEVQQNQLYSSDTTLKTQENSSLESFSSCTNTAYVKNGTAACNHKNDNSFDLHVHAQDALEKHKRLLKDTSASPPSIEKDMPKKSFKNWSESNLGTLSLVDMWSSNYIGPERNAEKCIQKLQEEKLRRTRCEEMIQQLQNRILEQQEKLAVAIQVDEAKDTAIIRFHDAWERVTMKFKLICKEKEQLEKEMERMITQCKDVEDETRQKTEYYEKEISKALNSARVNQEKLEAAEIHCRDLENQIELFDSTKAVMQRELANEIEKSRQLSTILGNKEIELTETKNLLHHTKKEVLQTKAAVDMCQRDFTTIKSEYDLVQHELEGERVTVGQLHEQNKRLYEELEIQKRLEVSHKSKYDLVQRELEAGRMTVGQLRELNKKLLEELDSQKTLEKNLKDNVKELKDRLEGSKVELRSFYQGQVELLVQNKLKEFQKQLDDAESSMKEEMNKKEVEIAKSAASHIQQITEKYTEEISLLEQKHDEEIQLQNVKAAQFEERFREMQTKFERHQEKRADISKQLQKVMEVQWTEALKIINNIRSPVTTQDSSDTTIDQLQSLHSRSYQNIETILTDEIDTQKQLTSKYSKHGSQGCFQSKENKFDDSNCPTIKAPITCKPKASKHDENNLQKYINMLLHRDQGVTFGPSKEKPKTSAEIPTLERSSWQQPKEKQSK